MLGFRVCVWKLSKKIFHEEKLFWRFREHTFIRTTRTHKLARCLLLIYSVLLARSEWRSISLYESLKISLKSWVRRRLRNAYAKSMAQSINCNWIRARWGREKTRSWLLSKFLRVISLQQKFRQIHTSLRWTSKSSSIYWSMSKQLASIFYFH